MEEDLWGKVIAIQLFTFKMMNSIHEVRGTPDWESLFEASSDEMLAFLLSSIPIAFLKFTASHVD